MSAKKKHTAGWITAFIIAFLILGLLRVLFIQTHIIHNTSMCNALLPGDVVFINKVIYGARLPNTPLSIPFTDIYYEKVRLPYLRFPGKGTLQKNDLIALNYPPDTLLPPDKRPIQIKRLIAIPGDTIRMLRKKMYVNSKLLKSGSLKYAHILCCPNKQQINSLIKEYQLTEGGILNEKKGTYTFFLTPAEASELQKKDGIKSIKISNINSTSEYIFNSTHNYSKWNHDNFGPVVVPGKNLTLPVNMNTITAYETILSLYEHNKLEIKDSLILINGQPTALYTFRKNYYFVLDDNRDNSNDSRNWGFLPEEFIIGKTTRILFSFNFQNPWWKIVRWNRLLKKPD